MATEGQFSLPENFSALDEPHSEFVAASTKPGAKLVLVQLPEGVEAGASWTIDAAELKAAITGSTGSAGAAAAAAPKPVNMFALSAATGQLEPVEHAVRLRRPQSGSASAPSATPSAPMASLFARRLPGGVSQMEAVGAVDPPAEDGLPPPPSAKKQRTTPIKTPKASSKKSAKKSARKSAKKSAKKVGKVGKQ